MKTIDEIQHELRELARELGKFKEAQSSGEVRSLNESRSSDVTQPLGEVKIDFGRISLDASGMAVVPHPLDKSDIYTQNCYLTFLLSLCKFDPEKLSYSLLLVHRIAYGMNYLKKGSDLKAEYGAARTFSNKQFDEIQKLLKDNDGRFMLVLDCLLTVGGFERGRNKALGYVAQLSERLGIDREQLMFLSSMAVAILTQEIEGFADSFVRGMISQSFGNIKKFISANDKQSMAREYQLWKELESAFDNYKDQSGASAFSTLSMTAFKRLTNQGTDYSENVSREFILSDNIVIYHLFYRTLVDYGFSPWDIALGGIDYLDDTVVQDLKQYLAVSKTCPGIMSKIDLHDRFRQSVDDYNVEENALKTSSEKKDTSPKSAWNISVFVSSQDSSYANNTAEIYDIFTAETDDPLKHDRPIPNCIPMLVLYIQLNKANNPIGKWNIFKCYLDELTAPYLNKKS